MPNQYPKTFSILFFFLASLITLINVTLITLINVIKIYSYSYSLCFCRNIGILEMLNICRKKRFESVPVLPYRKGQRNKRMRRACLEVDSEILGSFRGTRARARQKRFLPPGSYRLPSLGYPVLDANADSR